MRKPSSADDYIVSLEHFQNETRRLREILLKLPLEESIKWMSPAYSYRGRLVLSLVAFQKHFGLWFHQGALLSDPDNVLVNAQEGKTKAMRHWRFTSGKQIRVRKITAYVKEAMEHAEQGRSVPIAKAKPVDVPRELQAALDRDPACAEAFEAMPPGKRRDYAEHVAGAKRQETRDRRLEKVLPMIRAGKGLHDKYR